MTTAETTARRRPSPLTHRRLNGNAIERTGPARYDVSTAAAEEWDALVGRFPDRTVFHGLPWLESIEEAYDAELSLLKVESAGTCVAVWPLLTQRKGPLRIMGSPLPGWATVYMGPLLAADAEPAAVLAALLADRRVAGAAYAYVKVLDADRSVDLGAYGFEALFGYETYLVPLAPPEDVLWANLKGTCRTRVRKAEKNGLEVRRENDPGFLDEFWQMSLEVYALSGQQPNYSRRLLQNVWERLQPRDQLLCVSAYQDDRRIGTLILPHDDQTVHYWAGASYTDTKRLAPNNLLHWRAMLEAKRMGLQRYDFVSIYGSAGKFKSTFGGVPCRVATHWERYRWPWVRALKQLYEKHAKRRMALPSVAAGGRGA